MKAQRPTGARSVVFFFPLKMMFFLQFSTAPGCSVRGRCSEAPGVFREENTEDKENTPWQRRGPQRRCAPWGGGMPALTGVWAGDGGVTTQGRAGA